MGLTSYLELLFLLILLLAIPAASASQAATLGRSVDDMVGAFTIEKTIKLGSQGSFGEPDADPLAIPESPGRVVATIDDDLPPSLSGFELGPETMDAKSAQVVGFEIHVLDDQAGLGRESSIRFTSPSGSQHAESTFSQENLTSGTPRDGTYSGSLMLPANSEPGTWTLEAITLVDGAGNSNILTRDDLAKMGLQYEFAVI